MRRMLWVAVVLAAGLAAGSAQADYEFQFADAAGTAGTSFTVPQGATVDVRVYLLETDGGTTLADIGLASLGGAVSVRDAAVASLDAVTPNPAFDGATAFATGDYGEIRLFQDAGPPVKAPTTGSDANRVLLGAFTFTGGAVGSTLAMTLDPTGSADTVLDDGTVLDHLIRQSSAVVTVTAVPEPGAFALAGLPAALWAARRLGRRSRPN